MDTKQSEAFRLVEELEDAALGFHRTGDMSRCQNAKKAIRTHIAELEAQVWQCGAGAGCCAQAARIEALEAQLEAVGADPDDEAVPANAAESYTQRVIEALYENGDPVSADAAEELQRLAAQLEAVGAGGVGPLMAAPAQPQDGVAFELWRADHMPDATSAEALAEWCTLHSGQPPADLLQVVHRILCDAYSAGRDGKDFDLLTAKSKVAALFSGAQQHPTSQGLAAHFKEKL